jgi:acyl-CoA synthetase (AMP-forming)/AMP-acid ligase II
MNDTMAERFRARAAACGDGCAQILGDRRTSYAELDQRASRVGNGLIALGAAPQSRIGCLGKNSDLFFELLLGAWKANVVLVPVNWRLAPREMAAVLADAGVSVLFVGPGFRDAVAAIEAAGHRLEHRISMDGADPDWPDFVAWRDSQSAVDPRVPTSPDDTAIQLYTSGTTGLPKGVELSSRNYLAGLETWSATGVGDLTTRDVVLTCMPLYHVAGTNIGLVALLSGAVNVVMEEVSIPGILDLVPRHRVTYALFVPAVVLGLVQHGSFFTAPRRSPRRPSCARASFCRTPGSGNFMA